MDLPNFSIKRISLSMLFVGAVSGFLGVVLGAFGAHGLSAMLEESGHAETWKTAVFYQFVHALALVMVAVWPSLSSVASRLWGWVLVSWGFGTLLFSGSLYALSLGGPRWLGPITPIGGLFLMAGWVLLAILAWRWAATGIHPKGQPSVQ